MEYETVQLEEKIIVGYQTRTANSAPDMASKIGALWQKLFSQGVVTAMPNRIGDCSFGLYTNYEKESLGCYDVIAGCAVGSRENIPEQCVCVEIPPGQYAKFSFVVGKQSDEIAAAWGNIWQMDLPRAFTVDFEEYLPEKEGKVTVNIYIALTSN